jgi:hypothetical protein
VQKLTRLGLAVCAVLALAAFAGAPAAVAQDKFHASTYPATVSGQAVEAQLNTDQGGATCTLSLQAETINAGSPTLTATPSGACKLAGVSRQLETNGCKFILNPDWGTYSIGPKGCGPMTVTLGGCKVSIPAQAGLSAEYENVGGSPETVKFTSTAQNLTYSHPDLNCSGPATETSDGDLLGGWTLKASPSHFWVEEDVYSAGFEAESYPATFSGSSPLQQFVTEGGSVECAASFAGSASGASNTLSLAPTYTNCKAFGFASATVSSNGCSLVYGATGKVSISCPVGNAITVTANNCTVKIPAQSGLASASYENVPVSGRQGILIDSNVAGLSYEVTKDGFACPFAGTGSRTGGTHSGDTVVQGFDSGGARQNIRQGS